MIIYTTDHAPAHVHVKSPGKEAKVELRPVEIVENWGFKPQEIKTILKMVHDNQQFLLEKWDEYYPSR